MNSAEKFWIINEGVFLEMYSDPALFWAETTLLQNGSSPTFIAEDGTNWDVTATDDAKTALIKAHFVLDHLEDRNGAPVATR